MGKFNTKHAYFTKGLKADYGWILLFYSIFYSILLNAISAKLISEGQKIWIKGRIEEDRKGKINKRCKNGISSK